jgi:uncharacterized membrane protein
MRYIRKITKIVTDHTYTQLRFTNMKSFAMFSTLSAIEGNKTVKRHIPIINIIPGRIIPLSKVVRFLILDIK